jgi:hypothetical protein
MCYENAEMEAEMSEGKTWCMIGVQAGQRLPSAFVEALTKHCPGNYTKGSLYSKLKLSSAVNLRSFMLGSLCVSEIVHTMAESPCFGDSKEHSENRNYLALIHFFVNCCLTLI